MTRPPVVGLGACCAELSPADNKRATAPANTYATGFPIIEITPYTVSESSPKTVRSILFRGWGKSILLANFHVSVITRQERTLATADRRLSRNSAEPSAFAAELFEPAGESGVGGGFDVEEFEAHADAGFDDADHGEGLNGFAFAGEGDTSPRLYGEGLARADETAAEREVRGNTIAAEAGFEVEDLRVGGKRKTDSVAAVAQANFVRHPIGGSVVHGDNVAHCQLNRGRESQE
jgi:hypothetical protein